jgi:hypothetical protein
MALVAIFQTAPMTAEPPTMWNDHLANDTLLHSVLTGDLESAQLALAAGASVMWNWPRQRYSLMQLAIRLHSVTFVDFLMANGATAGAAELDVLEEEVRSSALRPSSEVRRLRGVAATLHQHGVDFDSHIDALAEQRPDWFQGIRAHCHQHRATVVKAPRVQPRPRLHG